MDLQNYINLYHKGNKSEFARVCGLTHQMISKLCRDGGYVSRNTDKKISEATGGKVTAHDLIERAREME